MYCKANDCKIISASLIQAKTKNTIYFCDSLNLGHNEGLIQEQLHLVKNLAITQSCGLQPYCALAAFCRVDLPPVLLKSTEYFFFFLAENDWSNLQYLYYGIL